MTTLNTVISHLILVADSWFDSQDGYLQLPATRLLHRVAVKLNTFKLRLNVAERLFDVKNKQLIRMYYIVFITGILFIMID